MNYLPLRAYRRSLGWSQEKLAERLMLLAHEMGERPVGTTGATVGRWERGERSPRPPYPLLLCMLFEATAVELGLAPSPYTLPPVTLDDVERRTLLRLLAGALAAPALARGTSEAETGAAADRLVHALTKPSGADEAVVTTVETSIAAARRLDDVAGPRVAARGAVAWREIVRTLIESGPSQSVQARLRAHAAELSQLLGWLAYCMNDRATSRDYLEETMRLAREAGTEALEAYALGHRSMVEVAENRPQEALALVQAAKGWAEAKGSPATRSWLAGAEADTLARLGDRSGAERALDHARATFALSTAEDEPPWLYYYADGADLESWIGSASLSLGLTALARQAMQKALVTTSDSSMVRDRAWYLSRLGQTYVPDGEVDEACRLAGEALAIATDTRCDRAVLWVQELRAQLAPWKSEPMVRDLDDQLAATSAWCQRITD